MLQRLRRRRRRKLAEHRLAREQPEHLGKRRLLGIAEAVEVQRCDPRFECGVEIDGDPGHRLRAEHLAPGLFQRIEHLAGLCAARHLPSVERRVMVAQLQRYGVGLAAGAHDLLIRQRRIRTLDPHRVPVCAGVLGHELDVDLLGAADRPRHCRGGPAKLVEALVRPARAVLQECCHRLCRVPRAARLEARKEVTCRSEGALRGSQQMCGSFTSLQVRVTWTPVSGSSVPKQRW